MLVLCTHCGRDADVGLATTDTTTCPACGVSFRLPDDAKDRLEAARRELARVAESERKLGGRAAAIVDTGLRSLRGNTMVSGALCAVLFVGGIANGFKAGLPAGLYLIVGSLAGVVGAFGTGALAVQLVQWARGKVLLTFAAHPPVSPGADATCHLCGGPLPAADLSSGRVECRYCKADNLFSDNAVSVLGRARERDVAAHAASMRASAGRLSTIALVASALLLFGIPLASAVCFGVVASAVKSTASHSPIRR